ncbi:uncharacterized protein LOC120251294 [Dioscorea cayenensis subsp. rotundata]|uniref:Uncharacterized protein LOC120251294 n=1 Tax=Dioscorea cayennensis subsp. rotundata TaxID=55577 RepID=A0AB40ANG0_DIOCR|nr:uncharacterized protein LOC120251294 [Dioscorea cayenensis subsp. rotundata]
MRCLGDTLSEFMVVGKVMRSLGPKFNHMVVVIEESKDLTKLSLDELSCSLQEHESRLQTQVDDADEKVLHVRGKGLVSRRVVKLLSEGVDLIGLEDEVAVEEGYRMTNKRENTLVIKTIYKNAEKMEKPVTFVAEEQEESNLFMVQFACKDSDDAQWLVDSGCSNHMSGNKALFKDLDESFMLSVRLGDNTEITAKGKGTVVLNTLQGSVKLLHNVQYVPGLAHNLLSVGQLLSNGYSVLFADDVCTILDLKTGVKLITIP